MMLKDKLIAEKFPAIRLAIYALFAVGCAVALAYGWITEDQSQSIQENAGLIAGIIISLLATVNVNKPQTVDLPPTDWSARTIELPTVHDVAAQAQAAVEQARADLERRLGR